MSRLIRGYDWASNALGPVAGWPGSLVTSTNLLLQSPVPIVMLWGSEGIMLYNDAYSRFAGKRHPQLLGSKVVEGWPEVADFNRNVMDECLKGKTLEYKDQQLTLHRNNKPEEVWMDLTYSPIIDESGEPGGVLAIVLETTERVLAEQRQRDAETMLRHERERLHSVFMQAPAVIAITRGPEHVIELANPRFIRLVGSRDIIGKPVRKALPEIAGQGFFEILDNVYQTGKPFIGTELPVDIDRDGNGDLQRTYFNFVYQPSFDDDHNVDGILTHAVDVTDQVIARQKAEEIANLNKTITDNATTGLFIMDDKQYCTFMNPAAEKLTGYKFKDVLKMDKPLHDIVHHTHPDGTPYPLQDCPIDSALPQRKNIPGEDIFVRPDGSFYSVAFMASPIYKDGVAVGTVIEVRDTTHDKAVERQILQLNKDLEQRVDERTKELTAANKELGRSNEELQDFAYVASHDLQEPLRKITAFSNLLEEDYGDKLPPDAHAYLNGMQKSSERMRRLINDLLTYSRVTTQAQPFEKVDLRQLTQEALEDMQARIQETKAVVTVGRLGTLEADPLQLRLLLQNLISNALKYARPGVPPEVRVEGRRENGNLVLSVSDNGIGFEEQYLDRIFTIFQRLHGRNEFEGTGVGLAICKKIVERHNGHITARSTPGEGATFIITLPLKQEQPA
ncbi:MAG TPA: ATP-binding protein [Candidatus Saccharimonadales bacterium]|nr:ATP-binding protein [Candidatus Saccharimonadales bacterium]